MMAAMTIELSREARQQAITSIERWFAENRDEKIGNVAAGALLGYFLEEIGPSVYNKAVADVQERLAQRVAEVDIEVQADEFGYWRKYEAEARRRK
jgi:uncharacterized protein (DUF2164 family)